MSYPQIPPGGYHWVTPTAEDPLPRKPKRTRRRILIGLALTVVVLFVISVFWWPWAPDRPHTASASVGTPKDMLIPFPLNRQPVPGWRVTPQDVGLAPDATIGIMFASVGERAYFVRNADGNGQLYGLNITTGAPLFAAPVELPGFQSFSTADCFTNGPTTALCVSGPAYDAPPGTPNQAWVIDLHTGTITFTGTTELRLRGTSNMGDGPLLEAIGNHLGETHLVASIEGKGIYGVGSHAELTWFVPGAGTLFIPDFKQASDTPSQTLAVQGPDPADPNGPWVVFSAVDGTVRTPTPPEGLTIDKAVVYTGGFAYQFQEPAKPAGVLFYDPEGNLLARVQPDANLIALDSADTPVMWNQGTGEWQVYSTTGDLLVKIPATDLTTRFRTIGTKIYARVAGFGPEAKWQQWDLRTGQPGATCQVELDNLGYVASDGTTVIIHAWAGRTGAGSIDSAINMTTCHTEWETPQEAGRAIEKVGDNTLIQRSRTEIVSLQAP